MITINLVCLLNYFLIGLAAGAGYFMSVTVLGYIVRKVTEKYGEDDETEEESN